MNRPILCCLISFVAITADAASEPTGTALCSRKAPNMCVIEWTFPDAPPTSAYYVRRFDTSEQAWVRIFGPVFEASGTMSTPVSEGAIYDAIACVDPDDDQTCVGSTVVWAPLHPANSDEIPETLTNRDGALMSVSKSTGYEHQRAQYNVYRFIQYLEGIEEPNNLQAMTELPGIEVLFNHAIKLPDDVPPEWHADERIQYAVRGTYEAFQLGTFSMTAPRKERQ